MSMGIRAFILFTILAGSVVLIIAGAVIYKHDFLDGAGKEEEKAPEKNSGEEPEKRD